MALFNLFYGEWQKMRRSPFNRLTLLFSLVTLLALILVVTISEHVQPSLPGAVPAYLAYPKSLEKAADFVSGQAMLLTILFISNSLGSEYSRDTWKMILPRFGSRMAFLVAKLLNGLAAMVVWIVGMMLVGVLAGWIGSLTLKLNLFTSVDQWFYVNLFKNIGASVLEMTLYGAFTLLVLVITRSTLAGIMLGILLPGIFNMLGHFSSKIALFLPTMHLQNVMVHWANDTKMMKVMQEMVFERQVSASFSLCVVLATSVFFIFTAFFIFHRQDMAGN